jgi:3-deoxy-D-manno-octulosonic-acid transferase
MTVLKQRLELNRQRHESCHTRYASGYDLLLAVLYLLRAPSPLEMNRRFNLHAASPSSTVQLSINGASVGFFTNPLALVNQVNWLQFNHQFTAPTTTTSIEFRNAAFGNNLAALDYVTMELAAVPEPSTMIVFGAFGLVISCVRYSRGRSKTN